MKLFAELSVADKKKSPVWNQQQITIFYTYN